ncbi:MAG TPA: MarR family winged helix-turn-helix transcriptional regulator [Steroidobacteraceae bacterium]|nr:MarR family winged helix-turn-helix transcriptional regulator [Steroidobacteraceae bacterium]
MTRKTSRDESLRTFRTLASFRLHMLARLSERFYEQFYQREFGLSLVECRLIGITGGYGQVTFKRVCQDANLDKSHASRLLDRLIRRRLLQKVSNPSDQRSVMLTLTGAGRDTHRALHAAATRLADEWLSVLSEDARREFQESMVKLIEQIRAMSEAESRRKRGARRRPVKAPRMTAASGLEPPLPEVVLDRKMARQLYDLLGTALGNGTGAPNRRG